MGQLIFPMTPFFATALQSWHNQENVSDKVAGIRRPLGGSSKLALGKAGMWAHSLVPSTRLDSTWLSAVCEGYSDGEGIHTVLGGLAKTERSLTFLIVDKESAYIRKEYGGRRKKGEREGNVAEAWRKRVRGKFRISRRRSARALIHGKRDPIIVYFQWWQRAWKSS